MIDPILLVIFQYIAIGLGITNICLLCGLFFIYQRSYRDMKSEFTIGLLYFTMVLLVQNLAATAFLVMLNFSGTGATDEEAIEHLLELFSINLIQFVALSILFKITW